MAEVRNVEVRIWGKRVGALAPAQRRPGIYRFAYANDFASGGVQVSPFMMPLANSRKVYSFGGLNPDTFQGLPGLIADALPDRFGNAMIDEFMQRRGISAQDVTAAQRLLYIGRRAMGALEFEPAQTRDAAASLPLQMASLVESARSALRGEFTQIASDMIEIGSSAGGARAKAVIGWNPKTQEIISGQFDLPKGFEHWLLKFDVDSGGKLGDSSGFGRVEYVHYVMARAAGVDMSECRLQEEGGRAHFMTRRFDRVGNRKLHVQSLCALQHLDFNQPYVHSYEQYFRAVQALDLGADALEQAWLRCAFNVVAVNCDDHTKNFAFLMDETGAWSLAPAYDNAFSHNPAPDKWTRTHQMLVNGKLWDITKEDLLEVAAKFSVRRAPALLKKVIEETAKWPELARKHGVPEERIAHISSFRPAWAR
jgi:serine/threonine-protein kinase HipA